jgi:hypothetical protein
MRDAEHYRNLMADNPGASVGATLAAAAIYAVRHGSCEADDHATPEFRDLVRDLQRKHGENVDAGAVLAEMDAELEGDPTGWTPADYDEITLTTAHSSSSYGRPVLLLDGDAYGPDDMTPAGLTGAALVRQWAARFEGP